MNAVARQQVGPNPLRRRAGQGSGALWQTGRRAEEEEEGEELEEERYWKISGESEVETWEKSGGREDHVKR